MSAQYPNYGYRATHTRDDSQSPYSPRTDEHFLSPEPSPGLPRCAGADDMVSPQDRSYDPTSPYSRTSSYGSHAPLHGLGMHSMRSPVSPGIHIMQSPVSPIIQMETRSSLGLRRTTTDMLKKWGTKIDWYTPTAMICVFLCGVGFAVGHHEYYRSLDGEPAEDQLMKIRYGTALAFLTKAALAGSVVIAFRQRVWHTVRHKAIKMHGLDALFAIVEDPAWFFKPDPARELMTKAKLATVMAAATWLIPLASVVAPGTLTTELSQHTVNRTCNVQALDFGRERDADWRNPRNGRVGYRMAFFHEHNRSSEDRTPISWYSGPSKQAVRIVTLSKYLDNPFPEVDSPCPGYNCTYSLEFNAPWYNCRDLPPQLELPFDQDDFAGEHTSDANLIYNLTTTGDSYNTTEPAGKNPFYPKGQGTFRSEPKLYFGWAVKGEPTDDKTHKWGVPITSKFAECIHQNATYNVVTNWTNNLPHRTIRVSNGVDLLPDNTTIDPTDPRYQEFASFHALGNITRSALDGYVQLTTSVEAPVVFSDISTTSLWDNSQTFPYPDLSNRFQRLYENLVVSFMAEPYMEISLKARDLHCPSSRMQNVFAYYAPGLWIGYALAIFASFLSIIIGSYCMHQNGMAADLTFSKIMVTTRNQTLDVMVRAYPGVALGGDPMPDEIKNTELRFGVLEGERDGVDEKSMVPHTAFGLVGETEPLMRRFAENHNKKGTAFGGMAAGLGAIPSL